MDVTPTQVRGVIFDKDGTLFDFATTWEAWAAAFLLRVTGGDRKQSAVIGRNIGFDLHTHSFARDSVVIAGTPIEIADALARHFPDRNRQDLLEMLNEEAAKAPQAEAVPLASYLDELRARGLALGVATNDAEASAMAHLDAAGVVAHFDFIAGSDSGYGGKPAPGQLLEFCASTGLAPTQVVMVGDSTHDLRAGRAAGMRTIGVLTGLATAQELSPLATAVLPDIGHLPNWLDALA